MSAALAVVTSLRKADDIVSMMREQASRIEAGEIKADEVFCIVRSGTRTLDLWAWGDYRGEITAIGMLEAAKLIQFEEQTE